MKYPIAIAALAACWLTASTALAGVGEDTLNNDPVFQEQEIRAQMRAQFQHEKEQEAVAEPQPPRHFEGERAVGVRAVPMTPEEVQSAAAYRSHQSQKSAAEQDEEARKSSGISRADWEARKHDPFENGFFNRRTKTQTNDAPVTAEKTSIPPLQDPNSAEFKVAVQKSYQIATARYPQYADPNSEFSKKCVEISDRLTAQRNELVYRLDAPERIADMAFAELNQQFEAATSASRIEAGKRYPQFADPNSELTKKYLEIQKRLAEERNPMMDNSNYPERIADMAASELKTAPRQ